MLAVDTNVLVYAHRRDVPEHAVASEFVRRLAEGDAPWAIPWPCVYEFYSVVTNPRIWRGLESTPKQARAQLDAWHGSPTLVLLHESEGFYPSFAELLSRQPRIRGAIVHDARVAALCLFHGVDALASRDRDFSLFPTLKITNPF